MVRVFDQKKVKADVIILGCSLPGIVTAHKLKNRFGNTMDIVVLDQTEPNIKRFESKCGVIFQGLDNTETNIFDEDDEDEGDEEEEEEKEEEEKIEEEEKKHEKKEKTAEEVAEEDEQEDEADIKQDVEEDYQEDELKEKFENRKKYLKSYQKETVKRIIDNVARYFLEKYANEFKFPLPVEIISPMRARSPLTKLFQDLNGRTIECHNDFHGFDHLNFIEKFELNQYQSRLDSDMKNLFSTTFVNRKPDRNRLLYYDRTTMETDICDSLLFNTSREIMRMTVRLVCGASADTVSLLFYLHQCFRTSSSRNHLDGENTRLREKLLGYCRKRLANKLQKSIADITMQVKPIKVIRIYKNAKVILQTRKGDTSFVCNLLAMALKPDELHNIEVGEELLSNEYAAITKGMIPGRTKKFLIKYNENIWGQQGFSGDIISIRGPIIWAMEMPELSTTGRTSGYSSLVGFLKVFDNQNCKEAVIEQLVKLFGEGAAEPASYVETAISDVYIPRCGDYVALRRLTESSPKYLEWGALDIFADGDIVAALEAGHSAYISLLSSLRPQAQTFDDVCTTGLHTVLDKDPLNGWLSHINYINSIRWSSYVAVTIMAIKLLFKYMRKA